MTFRKNRLPFFRITLFGMYDASRPNPQERTLSEAADALVLDLVEWIAREPRPYAQVIATWRTSCPRLTIWEDAVDLGYVTRGHDAMVVVTEQGRKLLRAHGRPG
jgi:hypothetical protein